MSKEGDSREQGIDFGDLYEDLERLSYPVGKEALLDQFGDRRIDYESGGEELGSILAGVGESEFESATEVRQTVLNMVGDRAIGRKGYTDRGGEVPEASVAEAEGGGEEPDDRGGEDDTASG